jgi:teichuronic acid biosynthesis glycosyltransferase TuaG
MKGNDNLEMKNNLTEKVSIIIPFYNCRYIARSITSALNQSYKNIEVIVVDDGSTRHVEKVSPFLNQIIYIKKANGGTATALNLGIKKATGDFIVWLSSDDEFITSKVEVQLAFMKEKNVLFSFTDYYWINRTNQKLNSSTTPKVTNKASLQAALKLGCPINGSTVMAKKELFEIVGNFDESLIYAHDYDYWIRTYLNVDIAFLNKKLSLYRLHRNMGSRKHLKEINAEVKIIQERYKEIFDDTKS